MIEKIKDKLLSYFYKNPFAYYCGSLIVIYGSWKAIKILVKSFSITDFWADKANDYFGLFYVKIISAGLDVLGIVYRSGFHKFAGNEPGEFPFLALGNTGGIAVAYHCLGVTVLLLYNIVFLFLPGQFSKKIKYMLVGSALIIFVNLLRIIALLYSSAYLPSIWTKINHSVLFVVLTYAVLSILHLRYLKDWLKPQKNN